MVLCELGEVSEDVIVVVGSKNAPAVKRDALLYIIVDAPLLDGAT